ncbi:hypothetical protein AG1IA_05057 [Rhizoctonia solani AG-1 IA]|uniref:Uncharacterized protein n=1 Tax=Thanatephorus cucumeris (strain AG1-IA) TaxID=983506 RepID=L8WS20_THACA|nr:hypothetical protein AG1IA_05057 [Rhizoctonia solani AG-1 IA]
MAPTHFSDLPDTLPMERPPCSESRLSDACDEANSGAPIGSVPVLIIPSSQQTLLSRCPTLHRQIIGRQRGRSTPRTPTQRCIVAIDSRLYRRQVTRIYSNPAACILYIKIRLRPRCRHWMGWDGMGWDGMGQGALYPAQGILTDHSARWTTIEHLAQPKRGGDKQGLVRTDRTIRVSFSRGGDKRRPS